MGANDLHVKAGERVGDDVVHAWNVLCRDGKITNSTNVEQVTE